MSTTDVHVWVTVLMCGFHISNSVQYFFGGFRYLAGPPISFVQLTSCTGVTGIESVQLVES